MTRLAPGAAALPAPRLPGVIRASWSRMAAELLQFRRSREELFFTLALPVGMLLLFGTIFRNDEIGVAGAEVSFAQYFAAGMIGSSIWWTCFHNAAVYVPLERDSGALRRLAGTPMPRAAYFAGKAAAALLITIVETAILITLGVVLYHLRMPDAGRWLTFSWVLLLGSAACLLFGFAVAGLIPAGRSASAVVSPFAIVFQFLSGVYFVYGDMPGWLQGIGGVFPLRWLTLGMRSVFLPEHFREVEPQHSWHQWLTLIVLASWCAGGAAISYVTFRWTPTREH